MVTRWLRLGAAAAAWLFAAGVVAQVFLAGLGLFASGAHWADHRALGSAIGAFPIALLVLAVAGRLPVRVVGLAAAIFGLYALQFVFAHAGNGAVAALHPVNALALFWLAVGVGRRARALALRGDSGIGPATVPGPVA